MIRTNYIGFVTSFGIVAMSNGSKRMRKDGEGDGDVNT